MRDIKKIVLAVVLLSFVNSAAENPKNQSLTFVQITDSHLFDSGKKRPGDGPEKELINATERIDSRLAWDWALLQINRMVESGKTVDFVVFTGDFGLEQVCFNKKFDKNPCIPSDWAVQSTAQDLRNLFVKK